MIVSKLTSFFPSSARQSARMSLLVVASGALLLAAAASLPSVAAQDPAPGWLSYAVGVNPR
jgi:hypothetical protein